MKWCTINSRNVRRAVRPYFLVVRLDYHKNKKFKGAFAQWSTNSQTAFITSRGIVLNYLTLLIAMAFPRTRRSRAQVGFIAHEVHLNIINVMKSDSKNQIVVSEFLQRLNDHDADGVAALFADDIDWYVPGNTALPWVGRRSHRSEVADYFRTMWPHFKEGKSIVTTGNLVVSGNEVVIFASFQHTVLSTGRTFTTPVALHLTIADNKIIRLYLYEDTWVVSKAFFD